MTAKKPHILIRHVGNMGDHVFFLPPVLESLKKEHPTSHITLVTAWGFKENRRFLGVGPKREFWGNRNQGGFCIALMMTNPHVDQMIHWHSSKTSLSGAICTEEGSRIPTWSAAEYERKKSSGKYDKVFELDFGISHDDNPMQRMYEAVDLPNETYSNYKLYFTEQDRTVAAAVMKDLPRPRIAILEGLSGSTTRGWDARKTTELVDRITREYGAAPIMFGGATIPFYQGRQLTLRENIATLEHCDVAIGVLSGPLHFAAAVGLPTLTLYADMSLHRTAPAYFLNEYLSEPTDMHRTLLGPEPSVQTMLKSPYAPTVLAPQEQSRQKYADWTKPGNQATKAGLAALSVEEVLSVLSEMVPKA